MAIGRKDVSHLALLDRTAPIPLYHQLKEDIRRNIRQGRWVPGDQIPTEDALCRSYGVSKMTVRQALADLAAEGLVHRIQGKGTFVSERRLEQGPIVLTGFTEEMERRGMRPSSRVLARRIVRADESIARSLDVALRDPVILIRRLRLTDGEPMGMQTAYVPYALCPGLASDDLSGSLYDLLERTYRIPLVRAVETHYATIVDPRLARLLRVPAGSAGFAAERLTYTASDRPVEVVHSVMRGDRYKIVLALARKR